jgi:hypothetical protein
MFAVVQSALVVGLLAVLIVLVLDVVLRVF